MMNIPRNLGLPAGISLLRQLNARANAQTLNLGLGKPEEDMPVALRDLAAKSTFGAKMEYTENAGDSWLRDQLAARFGISSGKSLILTHGAQEALMAALMATLNFGDEVLIPDPGFLAYAPMVKMLGGKAVPYSLPIIEGEYRHDWAAMQKKITSRTRVILISSPGNPTGCNLDSEFLSALLRFIAKKKIVILSDEVYGMLHFTRPYSPLAIQHEKIISINSFSKSHALTGWRIGFLACENAALLQACLIAHQYIATCASVPAQRFLASFVQTKIFETIPQEYAQRYSAKLKLFLDSASAELRAHTPRACGAFYLFPRLPAVADLSIPSRSARSSGTAGSARSARSADSVSLSSSAHSAKANASREFSKRNSQSKNVSRARGGRKMPMSSLDFCETLLREQNVLAIPGVAFGKNGEGSIRLSLALPDEQIVRAAQILSLAYPAAL